MKTIIKNGTVVTSSKTIKADVLIEDGKIIRVGKDLGDSDQEIDATGKLVLPGAIDAHTHLAMPFMGTVNADDYYDGTKAAACGGTTTVFDFAMQNKGERLIDTIKRRDELSAPNACIDYSFHTAITDLNADNVDMIEECVEFGIPSFKAFMVYDFSVDDGTLYLALEKAAKCGALIAVHAENKKIITELTKRFLSQGNVSSWYHYMSRPEFVETEATIRAIQIAKSLNAPLNIVHVASKGAMEAISKAREEGYPIFAETCPQYLHFTKEVYKRDDARKFVCSPPIKGQDSQDALWKAIKNGEVSYIATDHCPFTLEQKDWGKDDFTKTPNGCSGVENMYPYMLAQANSGNITFNQAVELCSTNVAKLFGCDDRKGSIDPGLDADIVIYDPDKKFTVSSTTMHSNTDHTIWEGVELKGYPVMTLSRGEVVYKDGEFLGKRGYGKLVKCNPLKHKGPKL